MQNYKESPACQALSLHFLTTRSWKNKKTFDKLRPSKSFILEKTWGLFERKRSSKRTKIKVFLSKHWNDLIKQPRWPAQTTEMTTSKHWDDRVETVISNQHITKNAKNSKNHGKASSRRKELQDDATFLSVFTTNVEAITISINTNIPKSSSASLS